VPVPEAQHRPRCAGQVHRRQRVVIAPVQIVRVEPERRVGQAGAAGGVGFGGDGPCAHEVPTQGVGLKTVRERQRVVQRAEGGFRAVGRIGAVRRDREDAIDISGVEREVRVGPFGLRRVLDDGHAGRLVRDARHACHAVHRIMRKDRVGALRPRKPQRVRGGLIQQQRRDRGRRFRHGNVIEPPAVGLPGRAGRQPEAEQHGRLAGIGGERDPFTAPSVGGGHAGHGFQHAPIGAVVDRHLDHAGVSALDVAQLPEGQHRHRGILQIQRHGQTQRRVTRVGIEGAGRIAP